MFRDCESLVVLPINDQQFDCGADRKGLVNGRGLGQDAQLGAWMIDV